MNKLAMRLGVGKPKAESTTPTAPAVEPQGTTLDDIASLDVSGVEEVRDDSKSMARTFMANETAPDAPLRDLAIIDSWVEEAKSITDDDARKARLAEIATARQFVELLDGLYGYFDDPELMRNAITSIMIELKSNPQYINEKDWDKSLVKPDDIRLWLKGMRDSMGLVRIKKETAKSKRASSKASKAYDLADELADLGISLELD